MAFKTITLPTKRWQTKRISISVFDYSRDEDVKLPNGHIVCGLAHKSFRDILWEVNARAAEHHIPRDAQSTIIEIEEVYRAGEVEMYHFYWRFCDVMRPMRTSSLIGDGTTPFYGDRVPTDAGWHDSVVDFFMPYEDLHA